MKAKLKNEGFFAEDAKKQLPEFPNKIAVVTSETGAAVKDIIETIKNKNDYVDIALFPVLVQGPLAAKDISSAIDFINKSHKDIDIIITGRGGGSMEELWAFNEEIVARSIFASEIPVISAVGHETDFTIADFVSDVRAATPTAAAEIAVPDTQEIREYIRSIKESLAEDLKHAIEIRTNRLEALDPTAFSQIISSRIAYEQVNAEHIACGMTDNINTRLKSYRERIDMLKELIEASNPKSILKRGYSVVTDGKGNVVGSVKNLHIGQQVNIETGAGSADAEITSIGGEQNDREEKQF